MGVIANTILRKTKAEINAAGAAGCISTLPPDREPSPARSAFELAMSVKDL